MAGNKTDEEYLKEQKELKAAIKKAEDVNPVSRADRDVEYIHKLLEVDFIAIYETLDDDEKRVFWRSLFKEIKVEGNDVVGVLFV